jgi:branched-chain amino acid transport system substrate-binding protein
MLRLVLLGLVLLFASGAGAQSRPVLIGAALAQTGYLADLSLGTRNALLLWQEQVNAAGGLLGRQVELKLYDDASDALRSTALYELLIKDDKAELLLGSFGSAATSMAAAVAERNRRVMVNVSGTSPALHRRVYRYLFQVPPPSDTLLSGVLPLAAKFGLKSLVVTGPNQDAGTPLNELLARDAGKTGFTLRPPMYYTLDPYVGLAPFARTLQSTGADVVVTPASAREAATSAREAANLVRGFKAAGYTPRLFVARGILDPEYIKQIGMDAEYSVAFSQYETRARTPGNAEFVKAYRDKYSFAPDFHAACGWAAGKVIEAAVAKAGSFEQEKLRAAFAALEVPTVLGGYKVGADGGQLAAVSFLAQILKGRREVIWPEAYRSAEPVLPMPEWSRRKP